MRKVVIMRVVARIGRVLSTVLRALLVVLLLDDCASVGSTGVRSGLGLGLGARLLPSCMRATTCCSERSIRSVPNHSCEVLRRGLRGVGLRREVN